MAIERDLGQSGRTASVDYTEAHWPDLGRWQFIGGDKTPSETFLARVAVWDETIRAMLDRITCDRLIPSDLFRKPQWDGCGA
jgi:hypothetical protein